MAQPNMGRLTCSQCGAFYNSEKKLNEHAKATHHKGGSEQSSYQREDTQKDDSTIPSCEEQKTSDQAGAQDKMVPGKADLRKAARQG
jgi:hypothetical protein